MTMITIPPVQREAEKVVDEAFAVGYRQGYEDALKAMSQPAETHEHPMRGEEPMTDQKPNGMPKTEAEIVAKRARDYLAKAQKETKLLYEYGFRVKLIDNGDNPEQTIVVDHASNLDITAHRKITHVEEV